MTFDDQCSNFVEESKRKLNHDRLQCICSKLLGLLIILFSILVLTTIINLIYFKALYSHTHSVSNFIEYLTFINKYKQLIVVGAGISSLFDGP
jgi:hypothetical protein